MLSKDSIYISSITLNVPQKYRKTMRHIALQTEPRGFKREIGQLSPGEDRKEVFDTPLELSAGDALSVSMQYTRRCFGIERTPQIVITMKQSDIMNEAWEVAHENKRYEKLHRRVIITIDISTSRHSAADVTPDGVLSEIPNQALSEVPDEIPNHAPEEVPDEIPNYAPEEVPGEVPNEVPNEAPDKPYDKTARVIERSKTIMESSEILSPTTSEILRVCPRFRLLVIGNSGVGKSSLIKHVFGVNDVSVNEESRGLAEIDQEFVSAGNGLFVLHDSLGLEAAEGNNLMKVKNFVRERRTKEDLKERLHAVWVCLQVPYAKGRLLEAGMEEFLRDRKEILGDVPVVVVLTKLDLLDNSLMLTMRTEGVKFKTIGEAKPHLEPRRANFLQEHCARLLVQATKGDVPHVAVSTKSGYDLEPTISELVKKTTSEIERYIRADPSYKRTAQFYVAGMAQRASIEEKVNFTIAIGKKRYWSSISAGFTLSPDNVKEQLFVIHQDITQVWNFDDPKELLQDDTLKEALLDTSDIGVSDIGKRDLGSIPVLGPLLKNFHSDVVTLPMLGVFNLASFFTQIIQMPQTTSKRFMEYIADLTYVMRILFIFAPQGSITAEHVAFAFDVYKKSVYRNLVHLEIDNFFSGSGARGGREAVVEKIEEIIKRHNISDQDVLPLRSGVVDS